MGKNFKINYDSSHPQARAVINGVSGGSVEVSELPVSSFERVLTTETVAGGQPAVVIGNGIQVAFLDGADPALSSDCEELWLRMKAWRCGGIHKSLCRMRMPQQILIRAPEGSLTIWQYVPLLGWFNLADYHGNIQRDPNTRTVTATSPFGPGVYVIGSPESGPGGGSGGVGFPGAGVVPESSCRDSRSQLQKAQLSLHLEQRDVCGNSSSPKSISVFSAGETTGLLQQQANNASEATSNSTFLRSSTKHS